MTARRGGFALVFSMLMVLTLMILAAGLLAVGTREAVLADAMLRKKQADYRAESAAVRVVRGWSTRALADLPVGGVRSLDREMAPATVVRVDSGLFLVRAEGRVPGPYGDVVGTAGLLVRVPVPVASAAPPAIAARDRVVVDGGTVQQAARCDSAGPGVVAPSVIVRDGGVVSGNPPVLEADPPPPPTPDPLSPGLVVRLADLRIRGVTAAPRPVAIAGECVPDRRNWGSPDPADPCHDLRPLVYAPSDLTIAGGVARAVLVVDGDLRVTGGAVLEGVVVVHGRLELGGGSTIRGAIRARSIEVGDGVVTGDACLTAAMESAPALDRAFRPPNRWWIPTF